MVSGTDTLISAENTSKTARKAGRQQAVKTSGSLNTKHFYALRAKLVCGINQMFTANVRAACKIKGWTIGGDLSRAMMDRYGYKFTYAVLQAYETGWYSDSRMSYFAALADCLGYTLITMLSVDLSHLNDGLDDHGATVGESGKKPRKARQPKDL